MKNTRSSIYKIIQEIQKNQTVLDKLNPSLFESVVAEAITRNNLFIEVERRASEHIDYLGKYKDIHGDIRSFAIEAKRIKEAMDASQINSIAAEAKRLNVDKSYIVTTSTFTESASKAAQAFKDMELYDRPRILNLIEKYNFDKINFADSLVSQINKLETRRILKIDSPSAADIDAINIDSLDLDDEEKSSLVKVDQLPLRILSKIIGNPNEIRNLTPRQFEEFVAEILDELGFNDIILTPRSHDGGKDVIASNTIHGIPLTFYFECKKYAEDNKIQLETMRSLLGTLAHDARKVNKGVLVTTSTFTKGCKDFILAESRLDGKDYDGILGWIDELKKEI